MRPSKTLFLVGNAKHSTSIGAPSSRKERSRRKEQAMVYIVEGFAFNSCDSRKIRENHHLDEANFLEGRGEESPREKESVISVERRSSPTRLL